MEKIGGVLGGFLIFFLMAGTAYGATCGGGVQCSCGDTLTSSQTMWYDLNNCPYQTGVLIGSDGITLNCNGHTIDGDDSGTVSDRTYGILASNRNGINISDCVVSDFFVGIELFASSYNNITNNLASSNNYGFRGEQYSNYNNFVENTANDNIEYGFHLYVFSENNVYLNNAASHNKYGIYITDSDYNGLFGNVFSENSQYGIRLNDDSDSNTISNNQFLDNSIGNAIETTSSGSNNWNLGDVGNYWSDFSSNPGYPATYVIDGPGDGIDYYPNGLRASCHNGLMDVGEDGIDCGGSCPFVCGYCRPLMVNGPHEDKIDIVFIPDISYGGNLTQFSQHASDIISNAFQNENMGPIRDNISKFNFYYSQDNGSIDWSSQRFILPVEFERECSFSDGAAFLHRDNHTDFSDGKLFSSEYFNYGTIMHEFGHSLFGLADEYRGNTSYFYPQPYPNIWPTNQSCRNDAISEGWDPNDCNQFCPRIVPFCQRFRNLFSFPEFWFTRNGWWRSDPLPDIMKDDGDAFVPPFQRADLRNIRWKLGQYPDSPGGLSSIENNTKSAVITLIFRNNTIYLGDIMIIYNSPPEHIIGIGDMNMTVTNEGNETLGSFLFWDPRYVLTEDSLIIRSESNLTLSIPVTLNESYVSIYNLSGNLKLRIDLRPYFNSFCGFDDGFCDSDCGWGLDVNCCYDMDGDGHGYPGSSSCPYPGEDCNDSNPGINPSHIEVCLTPYDDNCNGISQEGCGGSSPIMSKQPTSLVSRASMDSGYSLLRAISSFFHSISQK